MAGRQPGGATVKALFHGTVEGNRRTLRNLPDLLIFIGGGYLLGRHVLLLAEPDLPAPTALVLKGGLLCTFGIALGAVPALVAKIIPACLSDALLGFGAGVMLSAMAFSLVMSALSAVDDLDCSRFGAGLLVSFGLAVGMMGLFILSRLMPDVHPGCEGAPLSGGIPPRILLFVTAIALHNIPEGMAVDVSAGTGLDEVNGLALGIALQDISEGLVVTLVLVRVGISRFEAMLVGAASGLVKPLFTVLCTWLVGLFALLLLWGLTAAAGAMFSVVIHEIIPESHYQGHATEATLGPMFDFCLMMVLDTALG